MPPRKRPHPQPELPALNVDVLGEQGRALLPSVAQRRHDVIVSRCRDHADLFCQFVMRDEKTGRRILPAAPMHKEWTRLIDEHDRLVLWSFVDSGKTQRLSISRVLWEIGRNPNIRVVVVSKTKALAQKIVRAAQQIIAGETLSSVAYREVFPRVRPAKDPSLPWTSLAITVDRDAPSKDPTIQASGCFGNIIGSRFDLLILDDMLDSVNTRTPAPRAAIWDWVHGTLLGRMAEKARIVCVGNAWHPDDMMHRFARKEGYHAVRFPVADEAGVPAWPEHWPTERIERARGEFGPLDYARQLFCQPRDDDSARFKREWLEACLERGRGLRLVRTRADFLDEYAAPHLAAVYRLGGDGESGIRFYTGVDLAVQQHAAADTTSFATIAILPDGTRRLLCLESGRWGAPEILRRISDHWERYGATFVVENNAAQQYIVQLVQHTTAIPVIPYTTGAKKASPQFGIEQLAVEFAAAKWILPSPGAPADRRGHPVGEPEAVHPEVFGLIQEVLAYDPRSHTGDRLMSLFFAREGAVLEERRASGRSVGVRVFSPEDDEAA